MSDLETRLSEALARGADDAPVVTGLADAARRRARERRRTQVAGAAALVVLALGVPAAVVCLRDEPSPGPGPGPADGSTEQVSQGDSAANGFHWESWRGVTVKVPDTWAYGDPNAWCADGDDPTRPLIGRPGLSEMIACTPSTSYGVYFLEAQGDGPQWPVAPQHSPSWPDGAYVGATTMSDVTVTVVARKATVAQAVVDSVTPVVGTDPNGCGPHVGAQPEPSAGRMSVCRYDARGALEQSEELDADDTAAAEAALSDPPEETCTRPPTEIAPVVLMWSESVQQRVNIGGKCPGVTSEVLYWALSPGWTGDATGLPLPAELRAQ